MTEKSPKESATVTAMGRIEQTSTYYSRLLKDTGDEQTVLELRRLIYRQSDGGHLIAILDKPVRMPDGSLHETALIKGDSSIELQATKEVGREVSFTIVMGPKGMPFVKSYS